jgi:hypothetical protein
MSAGADAAQSFSDPTTIPSIDLRGYGHLSGSYRTMPARPGVSVLEIDCDNIAKSQLVQAKYLSDLSCLPGTETTTVPGAPGISATDVNGQGVIAALRSDRRVYIVTAPDVEALSDVIARTLGAKSEQMGSTAEVPVPMYLNRWDKFGFRFYYSPWTDPPDSIAKGYDVDQEFQWAKKEDRSGLVFWDDMHTFDTAEGMSNEAWWDWGEGAAKKYGLPTAINDTMWADIEHYRDQQQQKMPQYVGDFYTIAGQEIGGYGQVSWAATTAADEGYGLIQTTIRDFNGDPNVVSWLEPYGELGHGPQESFLEYGPVADSDYQRFLKARYRTLSVLGQRWYGEPSHYDAWNQVKLPELASFLGWEPGALDLTGTWRIGYEPFVGREPGREEIDRYSNRVVEGTTPAPDDWFQPDFDDSSWPTTVAPGNDDTMFLSKRPAVYRRHFDVPTEWRAAHPHVWLYVWDLNLGIGANVRTWLNGQELPVTTIRIERAHWEALDVSNILTAGPNLLAIGLPKGFIAYRTYLSPVPPDQYPNLGLHRNAEWVDFSDWQQAVKSEQIRRALEMIRQVDPNRNITQMSALDYCDGVKELCEDYGAEFHDTGFMAGVYADFETLLMHGAGLPASAEPGGPPHSLAEYKRMMGLYLSEGVQGVDYFIHIGDVLWQPDIRSYFESTQNQVHMFGKFHAPDAQVAILYSSRVNALTGYPWGSDSNVNMPGGPWTGGYFGWNVGANLRPRCDRDGITPPDFASGSAAKYKVILDTNTSIMDPKLLHDIEKYVRGGGTFVTIAQTGRHSDLEADSWPISKLTGYKVTHIDRLSPSGDPVETRALQLAPDQSVYDAGTLVVLNGVPANGLTLEPAAADVHNLLLWQDGSVAAGYRRFGKGYIVQLGCKWTGTSIPDRIEPGGYTPQEQALTLLLTKLMDWRGIPNIPGHVEPAGEDVLLRHWVSNNGLYDVWTIWNQSATNPYTVDLDLDRRPSVAYDIDTWKSVNLGAAGQSTIAGIDLAPYQTRIFLTARGSLQTAGLDWLTLQRNWWRGTTPPSSTPLPPPSHRFSADLSRGWSWKPLTDSDDAAELAKSRLQSKSWTQMRLGVWTIPYHENVKHAMFQKTFTVPANWIDGRVSLWLQSWFGETFFDKGRVWLDGNLVSDWSADGIAGDDFNGVLKPGTTHTVTAEIMGTTSLLGSRGTCWLAWKPAPLASLDLSGMWTPTQNFLHYDAPVPLPGPYNAFSLRRNVDVPSTFAGKNVVFTANAPRPMVGLIVNGHYVIRQHHMIGDIWTINITPWVIPGASNEIELVTWLGPGAGRVNSFALQSYARNYYP